MNPPPPPAPFFNTDLWRIASTIEIFVLVCVLAASLIIRAEGMGWDWLFKTVSLIGVFSVAAYASGAALNRHLPPQDYNFYLAVVYFVAVVAFASPWRWGPFLRHVWSYFRP